VTIDRKQALDVLLALTARLTDDHPLEDFLKAVTDATLEVSSANHASIRLLDASRSSLLTGARSGAGEHGPPQEFRRGVGVVGWVAEYGAPAWIDDVSRDPRYVLSDQQSFAIRSILAEPLWAAGEVIGVLAATSPEPSAFHEDEQLLLRLLANCSAPAIERARLRRLARFDDLTTALTHRHLVPHLLEEMDRARLVGSSVSLLYLDLDHFKTINDTHGHAAGDTVLRIFADRVRAAVRRIDVLCRRGGEEFVLIMPDTGAAQALATATRIQHLLRADPFALDGGVAIQPTVSVGVATWDGAETPEQLEHRADRAMYDAKRLGRNRIVVA
jgi:two-component system cell cycle response regulator